jgi:hypothetical protein
MQGYHTHVEMYRDTSDSRNIQKKVGAMPEKMGSVINHLHKRKPKQKKGRTTTEQETYNKVHKKQRKCTS